MKNPKRQGQFSRGVVPFTQDSKKTLWHVLTGALKGTGWY